MTGNSSNSNSKAKRNVILEVGDDGGNRKKVDESEEWIARSSKHGTKTV